MDIDDLLDFSKDYELFIPSAAAATTTTDSDLHIHHYHHPPSSDNTSSASIFPNYQYSATDFTNTLCVPNDDVAELEWLSNFVDDSFSDYPQNNVTGTINFRSETSFHSRSRSKRSRAPSTNTTTWTSTPESVTPTVAKAKQHVSTKIKREVYSPSSSDTSETTPRRCTHCASEKTPQWRTGPLGPKTLCNACGVRYKSGRLVPEYRPAASPTFVLTQHSNSHRKVMELRRQKEMHEGGQHEHQQQPEVHHQLYGHHHHRNYEIC